MSVDQWGYPMNKAPEDVPEWDAGDPRLSPDERRIERLTEQLNDARRTIAAHRESAAIKDQEITRLQTALEWYADLGNYTEGRHYGPDGSPGWPDIMVDRGERAKAALMGDA